ncbi:Acyl-CoA dehydrogenase [Streptomyces albus]|uniref:Acyl-CoA dehydrogenase n=1 Tax=Streptomyces albus (strain ATCC 21838 / DSM 41398 / FERM P-419 / JCM 4703 / NBRC 107858) TaxID=1081613 RepID=A0A0B5EGE8_STRA4|nr:Acyl-CoA dehydrogenase [Streptomyces albus]AOU74709.1 Acyl-CoA dehydrogenase [Streptomyces albus]AYN30520.1 hypothetical protein DUI70_0017 [Streptomyces albus]
MTTVEQADLLAFEDAVHGATARLCAKAGDLGPERYAQVRELAADQGWFTVGEDGGLGAALAAIRGTGRIGIPLPLMDAFVAQRLFGGRLPGSVEVARVLVLPEGRADSQVESAAGARHVLTVPAVSGALGIHTIEKIHETPGLARPAWSDLTLSEPEPVPVDAATADHARVLMRLGLAVRALAAARHTHELAIAHAATRVQFGKPIGQFGAVQQRLASCQIDITAAFLLVDEAADLFDAEDSDWVPAAEIATRKIADDVRRIQFDAHHTLGAIGYFEEHEAPWLFRRVHADVLRAGLYEREAGEVGDVLAEGASLPPVAQDSAGARFRAGLKALFAAHRHSSTEGADHYDDGVLDAMVTEGLFGFGWPKSAGGRGASLAEQVALTEEITYNRVPVHVQMGAVAMLGTTIVEYGTPEQKDRFLPLIRTGRLKFCLGYSEPEAGSDLASLRTSAVREGADWVINGQKIWTTRGHTADYVWLAVRTDRNARPRQAGITMFLVPMDSPGITVQEHTALSGEISCTVFYDNVTVPDTCRVGAVDDGWSVITFALAGERIHMGGIAASVRRQLDDLLALVHRAPEEIVGTRGSHARARLGSLAVRLQATRALIAHAVRSSPAAERNALSAMAGVAGGELAEEFGEWVLSVLGPRAALGAATPRTPGEGAFEAGLRLSPMYVIGGGTNDIQRGIIARSLGLPRSY